MIYSLLLHLNFIRVNHGFEPNYCGRNLLFQLLRLFIFQIHKFLCWSISFKCLHVLHIWTCFLFLMLIDRNVHSRLEGCPLLSLYYSWVLNGQVFAFYEWLGILYDLSRIQHRLKSLRLEPPHFVLLIFGENFEVMWFLEPFETLIIFQFLLINHHLTNTCCSTSSIKPNWAASRNDTLFLAYWLL